MRNFSLKTKENYRRNSRGYHLWIGTVFSVCALGLLFFGRPLIQQIAGFLATPFYEAHAYLKNSSASFPSYIRERSELDAKIKSLEETIEKQYGVTETIRFLEIENEELRSLLSIGTSTNITAAGVIARPPESPYDTLVIDRGSDDGIILNAPVYYGSGFALGSVQAVFPKYALVTLLTSPGVESTVFIYGANIFARAFGEGGGVLRLSIPQGIVVTPDDLVILPSLEHGIVGKVRSVTTNVTEPEQHAYVVLEKPLQSIRVVGVGHAPISNVSFDQALETVRTLESLLFPVPENFAFSTPSSTEATASTTP